MWVPSPACRGQAGEGPHIAGVLAHGPSAQVVSLCAAVADQVSVNPGAPSADGQQYITSRSLLQSNIAGPSYWTVTIHAAAADAQAVRTQVAQLAAMPSQQLASLLRSHGEVP